MSSGPNNPPSTSSGAVGGWFSQWNTCNALPTFAALILGFVVGVLTGVSGPDATVLAAVLPVVLSAAGGSAGFFVTKLGDNGKRPLRAVSWLIILFSAGLLVGTFFGSWARGYDQAVGLRAARNARWAEQQNARDRHVEDLKNCMILEVRMNAQREALKRPPLTISQVCPFLEHP